MNRLSLPYRLGRARRCARKWRRRLGVEGPATAADVELLAARLHRLLSVRSAPEIRGGTVRRTAHRPRNRALVPLEGNERRREELAWCCGAALFQNPVGLPWEHRHGEQDGWPHLLADEFARTFLESRT